jgi:hypothetical protein
MSILKKSLQVMAHVGKPLLIVSVPGLGKSSIIAEVARSMNRHLEVVLASLRGPEEICGLQVVTEEGVKIFPPAYVKRLNQAGGGVLFLDEIGTLTPAQKNALLRVVAEGVVGDTPLEGVNLVAAMNPTDMTLGGSELGLPMSNRFTWLDYSIQDAEKDFESYVNGETYTPFGVDNDWRDSIPAERLMVRAFQKARPGLSVVMPKEGEEVRGYPTFRSWDTVASIWAFLKHAHLSSSEKEELKLTLTNGTIGKGAGLEVLSWLKNLDLPNQEDLFSGKIKFEVPQRPDKQYALLTGSVSYFLGNISEKSWKTIWQFISAYQEAGKTDVAAACARQMFTGMETAAKRAKEAGKKFTAPKGDAETVKAIMGFVPLIRGINSMGFGG